MGVPGGFSTGGVLGLEHAALQCGLGGEGSDGALHGVVGISMGRGLVLLGALVKLAVVPLHVWLGKVHAEASTCGSVLLAGVGLKLGWVVAAGYGGGIEQAPDLGSLGTASWASGVVAGGAGRVSVLDQIFDAFFGQHGVWGPAG